MKEEEEYIEEPKPYNPQRLEHPFVLTLNAPRGSGKTHLLLNLLILDHFYNDVFDKVYLICPSAFQDPKYSILDLPRSQIMTTYDESKLAKIIKNKPANQEYLFVLDDCITQDDFKSNSGSDSLLNTISVNGRHMGISLIIASQKTSGCSSFIRSQADGVYIFSQRSLNEYESIHRDNSVEGLSKKEFINLVSRCTREQYSFIMINYQNNKVFHKFKEINVKEYIDPE